MDPDDGTVWTYNPGDIAWVLASTALVWIMIPSVSFFYSGLLRRKNALSMIWASMMTLAVVSIQPSIGSTRVPLIVFRVFQLMFAAITPILAIGAIVERGRLGPIMVFVLIWTTIVYDPIATAALAISISFSKRHGYSTERLAYKLHNTTYVVLGTVLLWFGWFGFNDGSALAADLRAVQVCIVTNLAASRKWSAVRGFCSGAIAGLVAITPASGYVGSLGAVLFGFMAGTLCNFATQLKLIFDYDDYLDVCLPFQTPSE
ncbi:ammonium transporter AmtB-like domain-containing protein [Trametes meyenii]|nr:ammonium transporter AmtB-like domain-containing protein [Trametes meyenii]